MNGENRLFRKPNGSDVSVKIICKRCYHSWASREALSDTKIKKLPKSSICSKCNIKMFWVDIYQAEKLLKSPASLIDVPGPRANLCNVCKEPISELTLATVPHTVCCSEHLDQNPRTTVIVGEPTGTREDNITIRNRGG